MLTTLYRTNIIHRDKQIYLFPSHRFSFLFLLVDSNDGFVGLALIPGFLIEKVDNIEIGDVLPFLHLFIFLVGQFFIFSSDSDLVIFMFQIE